MPMSHITSKKNPHEEVNAFTFVDHLEDLRWTILRSCIALVIGAVVGFIWIDFFFDKIIMAPTYETFPTYVILCKISRYFNLGETLCLKGVNMKLQSTAMGAQFLMSFTVAFFIGLVLAFPYIVQQAWAFVRPALSDKEVRNTRYMTLFVSTLFFIGVGFGYFVVAPYSIRFFASYTLSPNIENRFMVSDYLSNFLQMVIGSGLLFQLPFVAFVLVRVGLLSSAFLKRSRRYAIIVIIIISSIIAPPDVFSPIVMSLPIYGLYEFSIWIAQKVERRKAAMETV